MTYTQIYRGTHGIAEMRDDNPDKSGICNPLYWYLRGESSGGVRCNVIINVHRELENNIAFSPSVLLSRRFVLSDGYWFVLFPPCLTITMRVFRENQSWFITKLRLRPSVSRVQERHKPLNQIDFRPPVPELEAEVGVGGPGPGHVIAGQVPGHQSAPALTRGHTLIRWWWHDAALAPRANFPLISVMKDHKGSWIF